ncbi:MAG: LamG-like jellyroll fold domain-containing protein [Bacteroidota bacterium]
MKKVFGAVLLLVAFTVTHAQVACLPGSLTTGLIAFYPFSSGSISDFSGAAHHLSNPTTAAPVADRFGNASCAYHFVKTAGDYLHVPSPASGFLDGITAGPFSISLWFQGIGPRGGGDFEVLLGRGVPGAMGRCPDTWQQWSLSLYDCRLPVAGFDRRSLWADWTTGTSDCAARMAHFTSTWRHLALVYTGTSRSLYLDGVLYAAVGDTCGPVTMDLDDLVLGNAYTGDLDDILIYNRALSAGEVSSLFGAVACCGTSVPSAVTANVPSGLTIYPNPSTQRVAVSSGGSRIRSVSMYTIAGAECFAGTVESREVTIDIEALAPGVYFLKVITDAGTTVEKVVKK